MMPIRVAAAVLNQTPLDWDGNLANILAAIDEARRLGASLLCLPELCITGYGCEDAFLTDGLPARAAELLQEILPRTRGMVVSLGLPCLHAKALYNTACLAADGRLAGLVGKRRLAGEGLHYEPRWFKPWPAGRQAHADLPALACPLGDLFFDVGGVRIGFEICEDAWVADRPGAALARKGVDLILNPSASHFAFDKHEIRRRFVLEGSRAFSCGYVYSNLLGNEAGRAIYDGGAMIAANGRMLASGTRLEFAPFRIVCAEIDIDLCRTNQERTASFQPDLDVRPGECVCVPFDWPAVASRPDESAASGWESSPHLKGEEFSRAVALGLFDYLRKSRTSGFAISLSGGADSAAVACLVVLMIRLGIAGLGLNAFIDQLKGLVDLTGAEDERAIVGRMLTCAYQSTRNSSESTREAARVLAESLGARFILLDVDALAAAYTELASKAIGRPLSWETDDIALQNIQARVRGPGIWMLANLANALLLATSNRSEAAVGYATMDGDTCGGLSPIAGIDKAFLLRWLRWLQNEGPAGAGPIPALEAVNRQTPTAELRPPAAAQTDEDDLMPYPVLDAIERLAIRDKRVPTDAWRLLCAGFPQYPAEALRGWVDRFYRLWRRNQWKRERYAPSFHLDDENLDPKTWCRFPILSRAFERELRELASAGLPERNKE